MCATLSTALASAALAPSVANVARGLCPDNINMRRSAGVRGAARCHAIQRSKTHTRCTQTAHHYDMDCFFKIQILNIEMATSSLGGHNDKINHVTKILYAKRKEVKSNKNPAQLVIK